MVFASNGDIAINESVPDAMLDVNGAVIASALTIDTMVLNGGSLTDSSGTINMGSTSIQTTGTVNAATLSTGTLTIGSGTINDTNDLVNFGDNAITTSETVTAGSMVTANFKFTGGTPVANEYLRTDGLGNASWVSAMRFLSDDGTPRLSGSLDVNGHSIISSTGTIDFANEHLITSGHINGGGLNISGATSLGSLSATSIDLNNGNLSDVTNLYVDNIYSDATTTINVHLGVDAGDDFKINGSTLVVEGDNSRVGIGIASPTALLHVNGAILSSSINGGSMIATSFKMKTSPTAGYYLQSDAAGNASWQIALDELADDPDPDLSAILDANGFAIQDVGDISVDSISSAATTSIAITLGTDANDDLLINGNTLVVQGDNSRVGINDLNPDFLLDVNGDLGVAGAATITGNTSISGTLSAGATTVSSLSANGLINGLTLTIDGASTLTGAVTAGSNIDVAGYLDVDGSMNGNSLTIDALTTLTGAVTTGSTMDVGGNLDVDGSINGLSLTIDGAANAGATTVTSLNVSDGNITNVGNIALDSISSDLGTSIAVTIGAGNFRYRR
jgi:cytoskeletal protein CcmA (bactofilin family)